MASNVGRWKWAGAALLAAGLLVRPAAAEAERSEEPPGTPEVETQPEEKARKERAARWFGEIAAWIAQPVGVGYFPATRGSPDDPFASDVLGVPHGTHLDRRVRAGYILPGDLGRVLVTYWAQRVQGKLGSFEPSRFIFGETIALPFFAGFRDDGFADGFQSTTTTKTRDLRIDYTRSLFSGRRIEGWWSVGVRRVSHERDLRAVYFALVPDLPPLVPPAIPPTTSRSDLLPLPDRAAISSSFSGRGIGAGVDLLAPIGKRVQVEWGVSVSTLRGKMSSAYESETHFYARVAGNEIVEILGYPFDAFEDPDIVAETLQLSSLLVVDSGSLSSSATVFDAYVGARWNVWKNLELVGGFRQSRYENVGVDLRPEAVSVSANGAPNSRSVSRTDRSAGYEGFYLGVAYRY